MFTNLHVPNITNMTIKLIITNCMPSLPRGLKRVFPLIAFMSREAGANAQCLLITECKTTSTSLISFL